MSHDVSTQLRLTLFGFPHITRGDGTSVVLRSRKHAALLIYLSLEQRHAFSRDTLLEMLWPDADEEAARNNLRVALADLRRALGGDGEVFFRITRHTIQFEPASNYTLDVLAFRVLLDTIQKHSHASLDTCSSCLARLEQAVALYAGEFLHGFNLPDSSTFEEWALIQREQLHQAALDALHVLAAVYERTGDYAAQCRYARRQIELEPWRELAHAQLMRGLWASGQRSAALEQYHTCVRILDAELGLPPSAEVTALYEEMLTGITTRQGDKETSSDKETRRQGDKETSSDKGTKGQGDKGTRGQGDKETELHVMHNVSPSPGLLVSPSPGLPISQPPSYHLPMPLTAFVGRTIELAELSELLDAPQTRLLTLVGAGGMGKTRLALEVARRGVNAYADGVAFVALAALRAADEMPATILHALDLSSLSENHTAALKQALREKQMLLVLDNFEHLLDGAELVLELLQAAPRLQIVATSRERLNVRGEQRYVVEGMAYESQVAGADSADLAAVRLFVQSARHVQPRFRLGANDLAHVVRICQLVRGMPLGLELAAAWVELLPVAEIASQIEHSSDFLSTDLRDLPERQRSMRGVFDWSWQLLRADEQQVFRQLSVFRGGFTLEAAQVVAGATLRTVLRLVEKSLVQVSAGRYAVHELLRQFAAERLDAAEERTMTEQRHSRYFLAFLAREGARLARSEPKEATAAFQGELDNIRAAWMAAAEHGLLDDLAASAWSLWQFDYRARLTSEGVRSFGLAAERVRTICAQAGSDTTALRRGLQLLSTLLSFQASLLAYANAYDEAVAVAQEAIQIGQRSGGVEGEAIAYNVAGQALHRKGLFHDARWNLEMSLKLAQQSRLAQQASEALLDIEWRTEVILRGVLASLGDYESALAHGRRALELCQAEGRRFAEVVCFANLANVAHEMRDYQAARAGFERALERTSDVAARWLEGRSLLELGNTVRVQGEYGLTSELLLRALALLGELGDQVLQCRALAYLGRLHCFAGDYAGAQRWLEQAEWQLERVAAPETHVETFGALAIHALHTGAFRRAHTYAEQGWQLARDFANPYTQAQALVELGHAQAALRDPAAATTYQHALERYEKMDHKALAAEPRAGLAALALDRGDTATALAHTEILLQVLADHPRAGLDEPFLIYLTCYRCLNTNADPRATVLLETAREQLSKYAADIRDEALRTSFLERVATHRELITALT